jgi:hypothetical protein
LRGRKNSMVPRPKAGAVRRAAMRRFITFSSEKSCVSCAATLTAW